MMPLRTKTSPLKFIALLLVFTLSFFAGRAIADWGFGKEPTTPQVSDSQQEDQLPVNRLNVLLMGIDARPGEKDARSDSLILVSIDRDTKKIAMVSIPRDTMVDIPGHGTNKINAANVFGGADLARQTVEGLLGVEIPYYVKTNFDGFKEIIDTMGGVDIDVDKRMYYPSENINLRPGAQRLDGYNALAYVRFRHDALGDIGRTERQQKFLTAMAEEMLKARSIIKAPILIPQLMKAVDTNLSAGDAILVARAASNMDSNNIATATLPGTFYNYKGISYWKIDDAKAKIVLNDLFQGVQVATITGPDINVPTDKPVKKPVKQTEVPQEQTGGDPNAVNPEGQDNTSDPGQDGTQPGQDNTGGTGDTTIPPETDEGQITPGIQDPPTQTPAPKSPTGSKPLPTPPKQQSGVPVPAPTPTNPSSTSGPGTTMQFDGSTSALDPATGIGGLSSAENF